MEVERHGSSCARARGDPVDGGNSLERSHMRSWLPLFILFLVYFKDIDKFSQNLSKFQILVCHFRPKLSEKNPKNRISSIPPRPGKFSKTKSKTRVPSSPPVGTVGKLMEYVAANLPTRSQQMSSAPGPPELLSSQGIEAGAVSSFS